ncbi:MAG: hypothetical protein QOH65_3341 [Methylobacteriaceae bacterium]|nr:hypothetical protein [Methylobacteriaceae bacterium]
MIRSIDQDDSHIDRKFGVRTALEGGFCTPFNSGDESFRKITRYVVKDKAFAVR